MVAPKEELPIASLLNQLRSPMQLLLLASAALTWLLGDLYEAGTILIIIVTGAAVSFAQEYRASRTLMVLRQRMAITASVLRNGNWLDVAADELIGGDLVRLAAGKLIPADGTVTEARGLTVDEAPLTGESVPVTKTPRANGEPGSPSSEVYMGTSVRTGTGVFRVEHTGPMTQFGKLVSAAASLEPETAFSKGVRRLGLRLARRAFGRLIGARWRPRSSTHLS